MVILASQNLAASDRFNLGVRFLETAIVDPTSGTHVLGGYSGFRVGNRDRLLGHIITGYAPSATFPFLAHDEPACATSPWGLSPFEDAFLTNSGLLDVFVGTRGNGNGIAVRPDTGNATSPAGPAPRTFRPPTRSTRCSATIPRASEPSRPSSAPMDPSCCTRRISVAMDLPIARTPLRSIPTVGPT